MNCHLASASGIKIHMNLLALAKNKQSEYCWMIYKTRRCLFYYKGFIMARKTEIENRV
jgi:hypothetical protein